jgi:hypothetical protein
VWEVGFYRKCSKFETHKTNRTIDMKNLLTALAVALLAGLGVAKAETNYTVTMTGVT